MVLIWSADIFFLKRRKNKNRFSEFSIQTNITPKGRDVPEFRPDFKKVPVPAGIIIGSGRNKILLKTALFPNCFKLFHKLIQLTETISDYGEEIKVFRQFLEEVCFFFLHICFRIRRTAFLSL